MSTTSIFVEILIVGIEALIWIGLLLCTKWNLCRGLEILTEYKEYSALITTFLLALAYVIGIFIDRVADSFYRIFRYSYDKPLPETVGKMRLRIMHDSEGMAKFLDYQRSRLRIARATVFNLFLTILVGSYWLVQHPNSNDMYVVRLMIVIGVFALVISLIAARRIDKAQMSRLNEAYEIVTETKENNDMSQQVVAAVCYRRKNSEIEFLLVRTKNGKHWTFPKGHVKQKPPEMPWFAASREAGEEAGVSGSIEKELFTCYAYRKGKKAKEDVVAAYLMLVESERKPHEHGRDPQWFTPELAVKKLAKRREEKYVREHQRVVQEAMARLE